MVHYTIANIGNKTSQKVLCEVYSFSEKLCKIHWKTQASVQSSLFKRVAGLQLNVELFRKSVPFSKFSSEFCENIWKTYLIEHLRTAVSVWTCIRRKWLNDTRS